MLKRVWGCHFQVLRKPVPRLDDMVPKRMLSWLPTVTNNCWTNLHCIVSKIWCHRCIRLWLTMYEECTCVSDENISKAKFSSVIIRTGEGMVIIPETVLLKNGVQLQVLLCVVSCAFARSNAVNTSPFRCSHYKPKIHLFRQIFPPVTHSRISWRVQPSAGLTTAQGLTAHRVNLVF
jgi:hypothetical protein